MLKAINDQDIKNQIITMLIYITFTSLGSAVMMWVMLKSEKGKNQVGAR